MAPVVVRVLPLIEADAATQMAIDETLLDMRARGESLPTVRLYRFSPPALSVGRFQVLDDQTVQAARRRGLDVVRRPTGGRAVIHADEITYAFVFDVDDGIPRGIRASYGMFSTILVRLLAEAGVSIALEDGSRPSIPPRETTCFTAHIGGDLALDGKKLVGSAQVWRGQTVLQHGSIVISQPHALHHAVFGPSAARALARSATSIVEAGLTPPPVTKMEQALRAALAACGFKPMSAPLSNAEVARIAACAASYRDFTPHPRRHTRAGTSTL